MERSPLAGRLRREGLLLDVLTADDVKDIHFATLEVLERTGVFVEDEQALDVFGDGGCDVDREARRVRIPPHVVDDAVGSAPSVICYGARDPGLDSVSTPYGPGFGNFGEGIRYLDPFTGEHRDPTKRDVGDVYRLIDALPGIDGADAVMGPSDVPFETYPIHGLEAALLNSSKPAGPMATSAWHVEKLFGLAAIVMGGEAELRRRPILSVAGCPISPLKLPRDCTQVLIAAVRLGIPVSIITMALAGATAPVTLAGTLVLVNAEVLAGVVLTQLTERGAPVVYGTCSAPMDLRFAGIATGSPEFGLLGAAEAQLARHYGLPSYIGGAWSEAKLGDAQMGHEKTLTALLPALARATTVFGAGMLDSGVTCDPAQLVMDDEWIAMVKRATSGIVVNDETLMTDEIHKVGPHGDFLSLDSTLKHMRELSRPMLMERRDRDSWEADGATDLYERARVKACEIMETHEPLPVDPDIVRRMRAFVDACDVEAGAG
jgi:trimethylamine---corrinoid protein Co-methyltransferase